MKVVKFLSFAVAGVVVLCSSGRIYSAPGDGPQVIEVHSKKFAYDPAEITLKKGVTYKLHLTSDDVPHSFRIKELGINVRMVNGSFTDQTFTPDRVGDYRVDCGIYCGTGHKQMALALHVVEK